MDDPGLVVDVAVGEDVNAREFADAAGSCQLTLDGDDKSAAATLKMAEEKPRAGLLPC